MDISWHHTPAHLHPALMLDNELIRAQGFAGCYHNRINGNLFQMLADALPVLAKPRAGIEEYEVGIG